jgi:hypothetical protein
LVKGLHHGISGHRLNDLRHTFATSLIAKNAPIIYVAAKHGHAKPTTTLQRYARWLPMQLLLTARTRFGTNRSREAESEVPEIKKPRAEEIFVSRPGLEPARKSRKAK